MLPNFLMAANINWAHTMGQVVFEVLYIYLPHVIIINIGARHTNIISIKQMRK